MFSFIESSLAELLLTSMRDLAADAAPRAFAAGAAMTIVVVVLGLVRRALRTGRRAKPLPATA